MDKKAGRVPPRRRALPIEDQAAMYEEGVLYSATQDGVPSSPVVASSPQKPFAYTASSPSILGGGEASSRRKPRSRSNSAAPSPSVSGVAAEGAADDLDDPVEEDDEEDDFNDVDDEGDFDSPRVRKSGGAGGGGGGGGGRKNSVSAVKKRARQQAEGSEEKRVENSLGGLTQRFVGLVKHAPDGLLDLNVAAEKLSVRKRRVYDITNVLEGIGLIEKTSKNMIQWKGSGFASADEKDRIEDLQQECKDLVNKEEVIDAQVAHIQQQLRMLGEDPVKSTLAFVTYDDLRNLEEFREQAVLAIKAPPNTRLEVPDPDEGMARGQRRYQIHLWNGEGNPIFAYLLTSDEKGDPMFTSSPHPLQEQQQQQHQHQQQQQQQQQLILQQGSQQLAPSPRKSLDIVSHAMEQPEVPMENHFPSMTLMDDLAIPSDLANLFSHTPGGLLSASDHQQYGLGIMSSFEGVTELFRFE